MTDLGDSVVEDERRMDSPDRSTADPHIYVFISGDDFARSNETGFYRPTSLASEGFVHASPRDQLHRVANKFYTATRDLRLMHIDPALVAAEIRWEPATGGLYPHIYGPLNMSAVVQTTEIQREADGTLTPHGTA
jgi:uncharacterized protein (DUF952 family)